MTFSEVVLDLERVKGLKLRSIRPGAEIIIQNVDRAEDRIELSTAQGKLKTRPLSEIQRLWERLCTSPAVHVDSALSGSGTSRNQPETILANLPYVEWLNYDQKKHIAFVGRASHQLGTLKEMDALEVDKIKKRLTEGIATTELSTVIVVADDVRQAAQNLENATGLPVEALESGVYKRDHSSTRVLIVGASSLPSGIEAGTYAVIQGKAIPDGTIPIQIAGQTLYAMTGGGMNIMVLHADSEARDDF